MASATVILVHGLWMTGVEMALLQRRLRSRGYSVQQFRYRTLSKSLEHNCQRLAAFITKYSAAEGTLHVIGHSLGGVLALQTLRTHPALAVDRVICLGSPLLDSAAGRRVAQLAAGRFILGKTLAAAIFAVPLRQWTGAQQVGVIAGNRGFGLGKLVAKLPKPNDGVVALAETCLPGIADHLEVPISHFGLVLSAAVAEQCTWFLRNGHFQRG